MKAKGEVIIGFQLHREDRGSEKGILVDDIQGFFVMRFF